MCYCGFFLLVVDSQVIDRDAKIPDDVLQQLKDFGMFGLQIPQEYGMSCFTYLLQYCVLFSYCTCRSVTVVFWAS